MDSGDSSFDLTRYVNSLPYTQQYFLYAKQVIPFDFESRSFFLARLADL